MGKFTAYQLPLKSLPEGEHEYVFTMGKEFFDNMECEEIHGSTLQAKVTVTHKHDLYDINMVISGDVTLQCSRCLDEMEWPIEASYEVGVKYGEDYDEQDNMLVIPYSDNFLNIAYLLKDTVVLAIPMKHVHPMGKCNRAMTAILRQHTATPGDEEERKLEEELIDEMEQIEETGTSENENN